MRAWYALQPFAWRSFYCVRFGAHFRSNAKKYNFAKETEEAQSCMLQGLSAEQVEGFCHVIDVIEANTEGFSEG